MKLVAVFEMSKKRLEQFAEYTNKQVAASNKFKLEGSDMVSSAEGNPQEVMFLIGEIAAHGESCLQRVFTTN